MKTRIHFAVSLLAALIPLSATSQQTGRPSWPKKMGVYISTSSDATPLFPDELSGYRSEDGKDFWNKPFPVRGTIRIFQGKGWQEIPQFPNTMNGCSSGVFMIRWRSSDASFHVQSSTGNSSAVASQGAQTGAFGYMSASNCEQPMFTFGDKPAQDGNTLVDIYYELKFWQAAP
jgi:hypothetical protein